MESSSSPLFGNTKPEIMGVLRCTPDSFSDGGAFLDPSRAIAHGRSLIEDGASILDVGGESTGPGRTPISPQEELERISNIIQDLASVAPISVDTYKAVVADRCLELGARIINDISALRADPELCSVIRQHDAYIVLMYSKQAADHPHVDTEPKEYDDIIETIYSFLSGRIEHAISRGIKESRLLLDPGMGGFLSPNPSYSWEVLRRLPELKERLPVAPMVIGTSRKGFLGGQVEDRDPLSQLSAIVAHTKGADVVRTHNVKMAKEFLDAWRRMNGVH